MKKSGQDRPNENQANWAPVARLTTRDCSASGLMPLVLAIIFAVLCTPLLADPLLTYPLRIGAHSIRAELANTPQTRRDGLMFRTRLSEDSGMVFVFPAERKVSMWMKNTPTPLSVAFIDANGRILNIEDMQAHSEQTHSSKGLATYAVEVNQGWFAKRGIRSGDHFTGLDRLPAAK